MGNKVVRWSRDQISKPFRGHSMESGLYSEDEAIRKISGGDDIPHLHLGKISITVSYIIWGQLQFVNLNHNDLYQFQRVQTCPRSLQQEEQEEDFWFSRPDSSPLYSVTSLIAE